MDFRPLLLLCRFGVTPPHRHQIVPNCSAAREFDLLIERLNQFTHEFCIARGTWIPHSQPNRA